MSRLLLLAVGFAAGLAAAIVMSARGRPEDSVVGRPPASTPPS